ncbi:MAG: ATP-dependent zinc metalloprotease FtsH [candidate division TM6 bacterium GW2011_GWF2_28_16]|nr:MAG: ATP-dependent zinc metalloprotease FtsH [candidate division TM6 bacterium GW2011_GWF2_28_16]
MINKKKPTNEKKTGFNKKGPNAVWLLFVLLAMGLVYLFWYNSGNRQIEQINYTNLIELISTDKVESIAIQDQHVQGKLKNGKIFETYIVSPEKICDLAKEKNIITNIIPAEKQGWGGLLFFSLLPLLLIFLWLMYMRQGQNGSSGAGKIFNVGKSKARFFSPNTINVNFKDVAGVQEAKEDLKDIVEFLKNPAKFERLGAKIPKGILLTGAPGNGKTLLAKAVAGEANCPFFSISGSDFVEVFVGVGASRVRDLFAQAKKNAPCIVFIDEIDAVGRQRGIGLGGGNDEREQTLNQLLAEMDGFSTEHGAVIILAATNRPDVLDKALLRPGRFDRIIEVPYPDLDSRFKILQVHVKNVKLSPTMDLEKIARGTPGFSGADLENLINEATLIASKANKASVEINDFEMARDKIMLGSERKTLGLSDKEKELTAYHESGHTLLNLLLPDTDPFHKVSIIPRGRALGVSWSLPEKDKYSETKSEMLSRIMVLQGGMLAEKLKFNEQTSGASNDIEVATNIARKMVTRFGMSELGPITFDDTKEHPYLGRDIQAAPRHSEKTAQLVDEQIEKIIQECYTKAQNLLIENKEKLELLAQKLILEETLQAEQVYELLNIKPRITHAWKEN